MHLGAVIIRLNETRGAAYDVSLTMLNEEAMHFSNPAIQSRDVAHA